MTNNETTAKLLELLNTSMILQKTKRDLQYLIDETGWNIELLKVQNVARLLIQVIDEAIEQSINEKTQTK